MRMRRVGEIKGRVVMWGVVTQPGGKDDVGVEIKRGLKGGTKAAAEKLGIAKATKEGVEVEVKEGLLGGRGRVEESVNKGQGVNEVEGVEVGLDWGFDEVEGWESVGEDEGVREGGRGSGSGSGIGSGEEEELEEKGMVVITGGFVGREEGMDLGAPESIYQPQHPHLPAAAAAALPVPVPDLDLILLPPQNSNPIIK